MRVDVLDLMDLREPTSKDVDAELAHFAAAPLDQRGTDRPETVSLAPCRICAAPGRARCLRCEHAVCSRHYRVMYGLCGECAPRRAPDAEGPPAGLDIPWIE